MRLALAAGGAFVGSFFGPLGTQLGWFAGSVLGGLVDPQRTEGPRLNDLRVQGSSYGAPIPLIWPGQGIRVGGNVVWKTDLVEHSSTSSAKGGPKVTTHSYTVSFRVVLGKAFGDDVSLGRVWKNNRLVDDFREGSTVTEHLPLVFYDGNAEQLPDPTEEAIEGAGMTPAYRGVCSIVFTDVAVDSNVIDQYSFELIAGESHQDKVLEVIQQNNNPDGYEFSAGTQDGRPVITAWPEDGESEIRVRVLNNNPVLQHGVTYDQETLAYIQDSAGSGDAWPKDVRKDGDLYYQGVGYYRYADDSTTPLWAYHAGGGFGPGTTNDNPAVSSSEPEYDGSKWVGTNFLAAAGVPTDTGNVRVAILSRNGRMLFVVCKNGTTWTWYRIIAGVVHSSGTSDPLFEHLIGSSTNPFYIVCAMFEDNYRYCWMGAGYVQNVGLYWINDDGHFEQAPQHLVADEFDGAIGGWVPTPDGLITENPGASIYAFASGCKAGFVSSQSLWIVERCTITPGHLLLSEVVDDVCDECGMTAEERNVDEIPIPMRAFMVDRPPTTGRAILETLLPVYFVDSIDRDGVATFIPRGRAPDVIVPSGDLLVRAEGETLAPRLRTVTGNHKELPRRIFFSYINPLADYLTGTQPWQRMTGGAEDARNIGVAVVLIDEEAKPVVDMWGATAWVEADKHSFIVDRKYLKYEPGDVMVVEGVPIRVQKKKEGIRGALEFEGVRSDPGLIAQAGVPGDSGGGFVPPEIPVPQETELAMIDGPFIGSDPREGLIPVAMQGALRRSWRGAELDKSLDGTNYTAILTETVPGTIGITQTALGNYGGVSFDEQNVVRVLFPPGAAVPSSVTRDAAFAGENSALIGTEEQGVRGEVVNFKNCDLVSSDENGSVCDISGFLRGRHGSRPFMAGHAVAEKFIVLPTASTLALVNSDLSIARNYKAVTLGRTLATADVYPFKSHGLPYAAFQPRFVRMGFMGAPGSSDILIEWSRQSRVGRGWLNFRAPTGSGPPLGEEIEAYRLRIYADGTKQTVLNSYIADEASRAAQARDTITSYKYTQAQQTTDFGAPLEVLPVPLNVAQKCAIGWGWDSDGGAPIFVPGDLPNYIPPYPPPDNARFIDSTIPWSEAATINTGLAPDDIWCIEIPIGSTPTSSIPVLINAAEFNSTPPSGRVWAISTIRGDTVGQGHPHASSNGQGTNSVTAQFFVGAGGYMSADWPTFPASSTVYLNIKTVAPNGPAVDMFATIKRIP